MGVWQRPQERDDDRRDRRGGRAPLNAAGFVAARIRPHGADPIPAIRAAVARIDPGIPIYNIRTFGDVQSEYLARQLAMTTMTVFGGVAFVLATLGIYALVTYMVRLRTRELGIRMALGAAPSAVRRQVIGSGALHALVGMAIGSLSALGVWKVISANVPGAGEVQVPAVLALGAVVFLVSIGAAWMPARRAARIDPLLALRSE